MRSVSLSLRLAPLSALPFESGESGNVLRQVEQSCYHLPLSARSRLRRHSFSDSASPPSSGSPFMGVTSHSSHSRKLTRYGDCPRTASITAGAWQQVLGASAEQEWKESPHLLTGSLRTLSLSRDLGGSVLVF